MMFSRKDTSTTIVTAVPLSAELVSAKQCCPPRCSNIARHDALARIGLFASLLLVMFLLGNQSHTALAQSYTGPAFKPFYGVDIFQMSYSGPETIYKGEVTAINDPGGDAMPLACGWVQLNDANGDIVPFVFDPTMIPYEDASHNIIDREMGRCILLTLMPAGGTSGKAHGLSDQPLDTVTIVGEAVINGETKAVYWKQDAQGQWQMQEVSSSLNPPSAAYGVSMFGERICGEHRAAGESFNTSFLYRMDNPTLYEPHPGVEGFARDVRVTETVGAQFVGNMWRAYYYEPPSTLVDIHSDAPSDWCGAYAIGISSEVVGWAWPNDAAHRPVFWKKSGGVWGFTHLIPKSPLQFAIATDINTDGEIVMSYTDHLSYQGGHLYANYESPTPSTYALTSLVNLSDFAPNFIALVASATGISNSGWIGGSYKPNGVSSQPRPAVFIPYDTDNDGEPDYREILTGAEDDLTGRQWLIDDSEDMRVGLHAAGWDGDSVDGTHTLEIANVYAVRFIWSREFLDNFFLIGDNANCGDRTNQFSDWGQGGINGQSDPKEIVLSFRNEDLQNDPDRDLIPVDWINPGERQTILDQLADMSYRLHSCIDYIQLGNEVFGGPGVYYFPEGQLNCNEGVSFGNIGQITGPCVVDAMDEVEDWLRDQARAIRVGSAYAGGPLRVIGPALTLEQTYYAYEGSGLDPDFYLDEYVQAYRFMRVISLCNNLDLTVDEHLHYKHDPQTLGGVKYALDRLYSTDALWPEPTTLTATEWGPTVDTKPPFATWWSTQKRNDLRAMYVDGDDNTEFELWSEYIDDWQLSTDWDNGFRLNYVLDELDGRLALLACYGEAVQRGSFNEPTQWDLTALRANKIDEWCDVVNDPNCDHAGYFLQSNTHRWTPIKNLFEPAAALHGPTNEFQPHESGCTCQEFCAPLYCDSGGG